MDDGNVVLGHFPLWLRLLLCCKAYQQMGLWGGEPKTPMFNCEIPFF